MTDDLPGRLTTPCNTCLWRRDAPLQRWDSQHFIDIWRHCQDDGRCLALCHHSRPDREILCAGAILVLGYHSIGVRVSARRGDIDLDDYQADGAELYRTVDEVLQANGVAPPPRNRTAGNDMGYEP